MSAEESSCLVCHSDIKVDHQASIHADYDVACVECHGGDPSRMDLEAMAQDTGFRGKPQRVEIPELCASCHSDAERMKPYNVPIDQYAEYLTSRHGVLLEQGDARVAVCTDCHGTHRVLTAEEPESTVYPENVPQTCARCHSDEQLMKDYGIPADQLADFTPSAHGRALLQEENRKAPSCATCHGKHGAVPPGVSQVSLVCGQCHLKTRSFFNQSPHKQAMDERKISECSSCHGPHAVATPGRKLFDDACSTCHSRDSEPFLLGQKLATVLLEAEKALQGAEEELARAAEKGFDVSTYRSRLVEAQSYLIEAISVQHTLKLNRVKELTRKARSLGEEIRGDALALISSTKVRLVGLAVSWVLITFAVLVIYLHKRRLQG